MFESMFIASCSHDEKWGPEPVSAIKKSLFVSLHLRGFLLLMATLRSSSGLTLTFLLLTAMLSRHYMLLLKQKVGIPT
jgi:hypothetical protein